MAESSFKLNVGLDTLLEANVIEAHPSDRGYFRFTGSNLNVTKSTVRVARKQVDEEATEQAKVKFNEFWSIYSRGDAAKGSKKKSLEYFNLLKVREQDAAIEGVKTYQSLTSDLVYCKAAERYLRDRVWEDFTESQDLQVMYGDRIVAQVTSDDATHPDRGWTLSKVSDDDGYWPWVSHLKKNGVHLIDGKIKIIRNGR